MAFVMAKSGRNIKVCITMQCKSMHVTNMLLTCTFFANMLPQAADAMSYVAGYTVAHDVSARHWQLKKNGAQWLLGKTFDTFCPMGPVIVTTAALSGEHQTATGIQTSFDGLAIFCLDPHNLGIRCRLNGKMVQNSNTNQLVHKTQDLVAWISQ